MQSPLMLLGERQAPKCCRGMAQLGTQQGDAQVEMCCKQAIVLADHYALQLTAA